MITYPVLFFGNLGGNKIKEDFEDFDEGLLPVYPQIWQYTDHQWLRAKNPKNFLGFTYKDYGISGAYDNFEVYNVGAISPNGDYGQLRGSGNFNIYPFSGVDAGFFRDKNGELTSADQLRHYGYIWFDWGSSAPLDGYKSDRWGARFIGVFDAPGAGAYTWYIERDEGARIYIGKEDGPNTLIFDKWNVAPPAPGVEETTATFTLTSGKTLMLVHYFENAGNARIKISWSGPGFDKRPMFPYDFGDSSYVREYIPVKVDPDQAYGNLTFDGSYWGSAPSVGERFSEPAYEWLDFNGTYIPGMYTGVNYYQDKAYNVLDYDGIYSRSVIYNTGEDAIYRDQAFNECGVEGDYFSVFSYSYTFEQALNYIDSSGNYSLEFEVFKANESVRQSFQMYGFYGESNISGSLISEQVCNLVGAEGFYVLPFYGNLFEDQGYNYLGHYGEYTSIYVRSRWRDPAQLICRLDGFYSSRYVNTDRLKDRAQNKVEFSGHYAYKNSHFRGNDKASNIVQAYGSYITGFVPYVVNEDVFNTIDTQGETYFRFASGSANDKSFERINVNGAYYYRYQPVTTNDKSYNRINSAGFYALRYINSSGKDYCFNLLNAAGSYTNRYVFPDYEDQAFDRLNMLGVYYPRYLGNLNGDKSFNKLNASGDYYYARVPVKPVDKAYTTLGFVLSEYFTRFVSFKGKDQSKTIISLVGDYSRESYIIVDSGVISVDFDSELVAYHEAQDLGKLDAEFSGKYVQIITPTLEYWLKSKRSSVYNMSRTNQYFSI